MKFINSLLECCEIDGVTSFSKGFLSVNQSKSKDSIDDTTGQPTSDKTRTTSTELKDFCSHARDYVAGRSNLPNYVAEFITKKGLRETSTEQNVKEGIDKFYRLSLIHAGNWKPALGNLFGQFSPMLRVAIKTTVTFSISHITACCYSCSHLCGSFFKKRLLHAFTIARKAKTNSTSEMATKIMAIKF